MINEDIGTESIRIATDATKITTKLIQKMVRVYFKMESEKVGEVSIKKLTKSPHHLENLEVQKDDLSELDKYARKYNFSYAITKDVSDPTLQTIHFESKNMALLQSALKEFATEKFNSTDLDSKHIPLKETIKNAKKLSLEHSKAHSKTLTKENER